MKNEPTKLDALSVVDPATEKKTVPLFARYVQAPQVRTGIRAGVWNKV